MITGRTVVTTVNYTYNADGALTKKQFTTADGTEWVINYENPEEGNPIVRFVANKKTVTSRSKTDSFGRKTFEELQLGSTFISRQFAYHEGKITKEHSENDKVKSAPTTQLVSKITLSDGRTLSYTYDEEERIIEVTETAENNGNPIAYTTEYTYDAMGQLLTEVVNGEMVNEMTYDGYGNILTKNGKVYTYGDSVWKDKLTAVDGNAIKYDDQGNPTTYLGYALTWEKGRQLKTAEITKAIDDKTVEESCFDYAYNANGIRTGKTVFTKTIVSKEVDGETVTEETVSEATHTYTLDGANILKESWGDNTLIPLRDNEDQVCGILYNGTPYYFLKNLQGDIIAIQDSNAETVARYTYDAWGACTITEDTTDITIATINPYRYRGYYYDTEIGMYYLQSRYYDPSVGRFISEDQFLDSRKQEGFNLYTYCWNNPSSLVDMDGCYTASLYLSYSLTQTLAGALPGIMTGITASFASVKAAIATSWLIPVCVAAVAIAIVGIIYVVKRVVALTVSATKVIAAVKARVRASGVDSKKLRLYTVYVIVRKGTIDVVYVGITKSYQKRYNAHRRRFPVSKYTMMPIATGLQYREARALEQTIITAYTLHSLVNMINSISPKKWNTFKQEFAQVGTLIESWLSPE